MDEHASRPGPASRRAMARHRTPRSWPVVALAGTAVALILVFLLIHGLRRWDQATRPPSDRPVGPLVLVEGDVEQPGPVSLTTGMTLCEAWRAAGGDPGSPGPAGCELPAMAGTRLCLEDGAFTVYELTPDERFAIGLKLDLNEASVADLIHVPGLSDALAARVVEARAEQAFCAVEDLVRVRGIGARKLEWVRPFVEVRNPPPGCSR